MTTSEGSSPATDAGSERHRSAFGTRAASALRYWEPRRLIYNLALAAVVVIHFVVNWPESSAFLTRDYAFGLFLLAVLANVAYCAAYAVDLFVQFSELRDVWPRWRWVVLAAGTAFAAVITHFVTMSVLASRAMN